LAQASPQKDLDGSLWKEFIAGNDAAFETLFKRYYPKLYQYGRKYDRDQEFVKDSIQELFTDLWSHRSSLSPTPSVRHYLYKSLRRKMLRLKLQRLETIPISEEDPSFTLTLTPEQVMLNEEFAAEQQRQTEHWLSLLTPRQREAIYLRYYHEISYEEMASMMDVENHTVRNLIYEALKFLRKRLTLLLLSLVLVTP
jgi:RNA polymerase sigma factor (sigma-70 family)